MLLETSSETLVQYSVAVAAISGCNPLLATPLPAWTVSPKTLTVKERTLVNMVAVVMFSV
jgi:hypothetical protein